MSRRRCNAECIVLAPGHLLPDVFQLSVLRTGFSEKTQTREDRNEDCHASEQVLN